MKWIWIIGLVLSATASIAQETERDKIRQLEQQREFERNRQVRAQMDSGILYLDKGDYDLADSRFRYALTNMKSIPSDLTFYFGKNSYLLGKYKQSVDWLTKYIQLKGTSGQFSEEAADWLKKAEAGLVAEREVASQKAAQVFSKDFIIDCGPTGKVTCPVCNGSTVVIKKDYLGEKYSSCQYCHQKGYLTCEEYNLLLKGKLKASNSK